MTGIGRRRFLQLAGGTAAFSLLPQTIARAASIAPAVNTGTLQDVEHIVVLMQENRSFDHYFGTLRGVRGFGDPRPVVLPSGKPVWYQSNGTKDVLPFHPTASNMGMQFLQDLNHDWNGGHKAWNQGRYDQWIPAKTATTMAYLTRADIPFHYALADAFTICDAYHCSFIGATDPNRYYMWTGYTGNDGTGGGPVLGNDEAGYGWTTYPERLEQAGVSWKIYQDVGDGLNAAGSWGWTSDPYIGNYGDNSLLYFTKYRNAQPGSPLYDKARTGTNIKAGGGLFDVLKADVLGGRLPQVSWIAAPEAYTEHPNWPVNYGAWYIAGVLAALTANPDVWSKTALFITYDENDGFFDHVVPPYAPSSAAQGQSTADVSKEIYTKAGSYVAGPYGLGQRVPMFVVSPWSKGGWACSQTFDHTSIIQFIEKRFGVHEPNISPWRRAISGDLTSAFDFAQTDTTQTPLPDTTGYAPPDHKRHADYVPTPPATPVLPRQEAGLRQTRPLPYDLKADGRTDVAGGTFAVDFASRGGAGATFYVTSANGLGGPWTYTVEAGKTLTGTWTPPKKNAGAYDLSVFGPNGFLRTFTGRIPAKGTNPAAPEVAVGYDGGNVTLTLTNRGGASCRVTVTDAYGNASPATYQVPPNGTVVHTAVLSGSYSWYDLKVTSDADTTFVRRIAGHVETGRPGMSDPKTSTV
ncbi:phospholipase C, phosphocholine-specific [Planotetraspora phitsanulokensis]|uniref:phospholipase C n=1 Tax=Planotetraspora phitsanulokensis TaxID=575192 RepID=A0A8J3UCV4_9ACTN|nr:phospholipase C, phosphocholine-specific [Planotetraspora phitsanulokensis]GII41307.1 non-hemolytic phospholipase C [Planotetraspora phitsanulokensis]